jgi:hypothetical protein
MEKPEVYNGEYSVEHNVVNWLTTVRKYLEPHNVHRDIWCQYAYTYMGKKVRAWYDSLYGEATPDWATFQVDIRERFLPSDHRIQVLDRFDNIVQTGSLQDYVDRYQHLMVSVKQTGIEKSEEEQMMRFISGLKSAEDRKTILEKGHVLMSDVYKTVMLIKNSSTLAHRLVRERQGRGDEKPSFRDKMKQHLKLLQGPERDRALKEGLCLECGKLGHWRKDCPHIGTKKKLKTLKGTGAKKTAGKSRKFIKLRLTKAGDSEDEYEIDEDEEDDEGSEATSSEDEKDDNSGNEDPETDEAVSEGKDK